MEHLRVRRDWMYKNVGRKGSIPLSFVRGLTEFMQVASCNRTKMTDVRCPCKKCRAQKHHEYHVVEFHLTKNGFMDDYYLWKFHGEDLSMLNTSTVIGNENEDINIDFDEHSPENRMTEMVLDVAGPSMQMNSMDVEEEPNPKANFFFDLLESSKRPLFDGCPMIELATTSRLVAIKSTNNGTEKLMNDVISLVRDVIPFGLETRLAENWYSLKKQVSAFGLPYEKIDTCRSGCMLYWKEDINLLQCKFCGLERYEKKKSNGKGVPFTRLHYLPLIPRLQRLYASHATAEHMRWHGERVREEGISCHPSDGEAWKHFDVKYPHFAKEFRNIRLGLCTDGFQSFTQYGKKYSTWPVILTPYNLPPWMCMQNPYMFLTLIIPGPKNPKNGIDVYLQPLIEELKLWIDGVDTYDVSKKQNFKLFACLLWTISDFPAYGMLSGWSTGGKFSCPVCMDSTKAFRLKYGAKQCWWDRHRRFLHINDPFRRDKKNFETNKVDNLQPPTFLTGEEVFDIVSNYPKVHETGNSEPKIHGKGEYHNWCKQSIFWELPYWKDLKLRHNLDVMHIEKNVFENFFHTIMNVRGKTKDDLKSRRDIEYYCNRPELRIDPARPNFKLLACYELDNTRRKKLLDWVDSLRFPDGIASNMKRCVDMNELTLSGMKSHDCHIFIETLFPIVFKELLPQKVWTPITELSLFFKDICSTTLHIDHLQKLEKDIPKLLCKLEKIFPPGIFNCMEHLPVHLPTEALLRGPVQYGWMYPFERYLGHLKKKVKQKARVEGSICQAYVIEEAATFFSHYFDDHVNLSFNRGHRNDTDVVDDSNDNVLSVFKKQGRPAGKWKDVKGFTTTKGFNLAKATVLLNCDELTDLINKFDEEHPNSELSKQFEDWFKKYVSMVYQVFVDEMKRSRKRSGCISEEVWQQFLQYWEREDVKALSKRNSDNRNKNPRPHVGGSRSTAQYRNDLEEEHGRPPTFMGVYVRMHRIDPADGSASHWVDSWSSDFAERYDARVAELQSDGHELSHDELDRIFVQLTEQGETANCKRSTRRPGLGNTPSIYKDNAYSARSEVFVNERLQELETTNNELKGELQELRNEMGSMRDFLREMRQQRADWPGHTSSQSDT